MVLLVILELDRLDGRDEFDVKHLLEKDPHDVFNEWFDQAAKILKQPMEANIMTFCRFATWSLPSDTM